MKLLLDSCLSGKAAAGLRNHGHDVVWTGDWSADPGDVAILARAREDGRVLVTLDKDFGELAIVRGEPGVGADAVATYGIASIVVASCSTLSLPPTPGQPLPRHAAKASERLA